MHFGDGVCSSSPLLFSSYAPPNFFWYVDFLLDIVKQNLAFYDFLVPNLFISILRWRITSIHSSRFLQMDNLRYILPLVLKNQCGETCRLKCCFGNLASLRKREVEVAPTPLRGISNELKKQFSLSLFITHSIAPNLRFNFQFYNFYSPHCWAINLIPLASSFQYTIPFKSSISFTALFQKKPILVSADVDQNTVR